MIEHTYKELYNQDSTKKQLTITFDGGEITNTDLYSESFEITESLCSEEELRFGSCEASVLKFKIANTVESLKNKVLVVSQILNDLVDEPFQIGKYNVYSDVPSGDRNYRNVTAYDDMYVIINKDVADWYESLTFPITQKDFRDSFFDYFGIEQEETVLIHDDMSIEKTIEATSISGKDVITAICELNGVFGHINRQGNFEYVSLGYDVNEIDSSLYQSCEYEDFETCFITKLQIREQEGDIGAVCGDGANCYVVEDNFLVYGKSSVELTEICGRLYEKICNVTYRPFKASVKGNPCYEVGDLILIHARYKDVQGYVLERTLKGIQALQDTFQANGVYEYEENVNSTLKDIRQLKGKTNVLEKSIEETKSTISDMEKGIQSQYKQTEESIAMIVEQNKKSEEQLSEIALEVSYVLNKDGISKNSAIEYYATQEVPALMNYPTFTDFFIWDVCSDTLYCSDDLICGTNDYDSHLGEITKNETTNRYYVFEQNEGVYTWRELTEEEVEDISEKHASVKVYENEVVISASENEDSAQVHFTPEGLKATALFCC